MACSRLLPHISTLGCKLPQNAGRSGLPKIIQRFSLSSCMHRTPAGLPFGMPGMALLMDGAVQHAPQLSLHSNSCILVKAPSMENQAQKRLV